MKLKLSELEKQCEELKKQKTNDTGMFQLFYKLLLRIYFNPNGPSRHLRNVKDIIKEIILM